MANKLYLSIAIACTLFVIAEDFGDNRGRSFLSLCGAEPTISEAPEGLIDGHNATFRTKFVPNIEQPLRFFRNGLLLRSGVQYRTSGQTLTLFPGQIPVPGDVLEVVYVPSSMKRLSSESPDVGVNPVTISHLDEIAVTAASHELEKEIARRRLQAFGIITPNRTLDAVADNTATDPPSIEMLLHLTKANVNQRGNGQRDEVLQGLEGLGDNPIRGPSIGRDAINRRSKVDLYGQAVRVSHPNLNEPNRAAMTLLRMLQTEGEDESSPQSSKDSLTDDANDKRRIRKSHPDQ